MSDLELSPDALAELERRHVAFLRERLAGGREDWQRLVRRGWESLLALRIREIVDAGALARALRDALSVEDVRGFLAPIVREMSREAIAAAKNDATRLGDYVPDDARKAVDKLLDRHDLIPDALVRKVFEQKVVEDAIENTLYDALTQFQTTVNPFFAEWGLPAILKRLPIGGSMILSSMEGLRAEFDRRVEPEIRKFLVAFSRRTKSDLAEVFLSRSGDPKIAQLRKDVVAFLYTQSVAELMAGVDPAMTETTEVVVERIALHVLERGQSEEALRRAIERLLDEHGEGTIGEWLEAIDASTQPRVEEWATLSWPVVARALDSAPVRELLEKLAADFYATLK